MSIFDILVNFIYFLDVFLDAAPIGYAFRLSLSHKIEQFGHCICVHRGNIVAAAGHNFGTPGLGVNELSRSHKMNNLYVVSRELVYVYLVPVFCA